MGPDVFGWLCRAPLLAGPKGSVKPGRGCLGTFVGGFRILKVGEESVPCPEGNAAQAPQSRQGQDVAAASVRPSIGMEPDEGNSNDQLSDGSSRGRRAAPAFLTFGCQGSNTLSKFPSLSGAVTGAGSCLHLYSSPPHISLTKAFVGSSKGHVGRQQLLWLLCRSCGHLGVALGFPWLDP